MSNTNTAGKTNSPIMDTISKAGVQTTEEFMTAMKETRTLQEQQKFQHYKCARPSMRMITSAGKRINFAKFELFTQDEDIIAYLDAEIKINPNVGVIKGALMSVEDKDPMAALKRQHYLEFQQQKEAEAVAAAKGEVPDMGNTSGAKFVATHSGQTAN